MPSNFTEDFKKKCYRVFKTHPELTRLLQALETCNTEEVLDFMKKFLDDSNNEELGMDEDLKIDIRNINRVFIDDYTQ